MIKFRCKHCSHKIGVKDEHAGRKVRCPKCKEPIRVPKPRPKPEDEFELEMVGPAGGGGGEDDFDLEVVGGGGADGDLAALAAMEAGAQPVMVSADQVATKCPSCSAKSKPGAALCVSCGYNFKSGKQLNTAVAAAPKQSKRAARQAAAQDSDADPPWKNILWGLFLIAVSAGIWWYLWDFENSTDASREVHTVIAWLYNLGGKWLASLPFTFIGLFMLVWGLRGKEI